MPKITVLFGLPRSGKSTWIKQNKTNEVVISADDIRYLVYNQRFWSDGEALMWSIRTMMLRYMILQNMDIIIDETNITAKSRSAIIKSVKNLDIKNEYLINCIIMKDAFNEEICIERAKANNMEDLIPVIIKMSEQIEIPSKLEGFNNIYN